MPELTVGRIVERIHPVDETFVQRARERTGQLVIPPRALGRLHGLAEQVCGIQQTLQPDIDRKSILVFAGDHGVVQEGVSAFPQVVSMEMIRCFLRGGAGINALGRLVKAAIKVVDMGLVSDLDPASLDGGENLIVNKIGPGTRNLAQGPAMSRQEAGASIAGGFRQAEAVIRQGANLLGTGDMGIGNTTPAAAVGAVLTGQGLDGMVGRGTGIDDQGLQKKKDAIARGLDLNRPDRGDGLDVLAKVGGFEIGGIAGCVLAGAVHRVPVVIDGFISTAGALIAASLCPLTAGFMFAGHCSEEPGHRTMLRSLGLEPILDLGMRLGEGTGGALAMTILDGAIRVFQEVMTFEQAGVSKGA
jgi:nicotinate-nucleotide--dimethylbenzimidazole phosphoribosyltransferase